MSFAGVETMSASGVRGPLLSRANPLSKLLAALALAVALVLSLDVVSASAALVMELALLPLAGLRLRTLFVRGWSVLLAAIAGGYGTALLAAKTGAVVLDWGPFLLTSGSLTSALAVVLRSMAIALPGILLLVCTDPTDLADSLAQRAKLPARFVLGALAAMRLVGLLLEEWQTLGMARRARGVGSNAGIFGRLKASLGQGLALLVQALRRAGRLAVTMEAKGFGTAPRSWARESHFTAVDSWVAAGSTAMIAISVGLAVMLGSWNPVFW
ncbi:ABC-type cobalt transport system, permease protein [Renibacterium salmoninarum ATCC 33209]|uniref:ABC-type cobalt transport system, permease protein n=1 Tax=Renibacterium salmoninarum (strain ATCC 33209 / DSM 20767 / JCM 11484 / NBRC 15589 / NCIMB 2235) TaxID=288705 RepID=A9WNV8_RENSM|nr:energy-coupling factor transporter transmembrane component T [Renibacterium salmoninarum]ABY22744.1 ABC-type cobalt transport system, permease protein [Renibacterium salmoninarum ATCC 33209]